MEEPFDEIVPWNKYRVYKDRLQPMYNVDLTRTLGEGFILQTSSNKL